MGEGAFAKAKADEGSVSADRDPSLVSPSLCDGDPPSPTRGKKKHAVIEKETTP